LFFERANKSRFALSFLKIKNGVIEMHINDYDLSMAMNDVSDINHIVVRLEKRVETLERILAAHPERTVIVDWINGEPYCPMCGDKLEWNHE
jgi:hypothetical protein